MADYQAQIRLGIEGLGQLRTLETRLQSAVDLLGRLEEANANVGQAAQSSQRNVEAAGRRRAIAGRELRTATRTVENVAMRRDPNTGLFLPGGANATARRLANANLRLAQREVREADRNLREEEQNRRLVFAARRRYARALDRAGNIVGGVQGGINDTRQRVDAALRTIRRESRDNYLDLLFGGRQQRLAQEGGGRRLPANLQQQIVSNRTAFDLARSAGDLPTMSRLATELAGLVRAQNEQNRLTTGRSDAFEKARRGQEQINALAERPGVNDARIRRLRARGADVIAAAQQGDITRAKNLARRMNAAIMRYTRELDAAARETADQRRAGMRNLTVRQSWAAVLEDIGAEQQIRARALPSSSLLAQRVATSGQDAPTRLDLQQAEAAKQAAKASADAAGSLGRFGVALEREAKRRERLGIGAVERVGGPSRRTAAIPMGGGADSGIVPRALPDRNLLAQRVAASGQVAPTRLDDLRDAARKAEAEAEKRAAGSTKRYADAVEREAKRLERLGIGQGPVRGPGGAVPMGGRSRGGFNQLPFPAGPGNARGIAEFQAIQRQQRRAGAGAGAAPQGFFRGDRRKAVAEGLIGGAFPLLFGQGLGASIGGAAGGVSGGLIGGSFGFGLSLIGTALGSAVDTTTNNLKELAAALKSPNDAITALEASGFRVGDSLKFQVEQLQAVGRAYDAQTLVLQEVERRLGAGSVQELNALNGEQRRLEEQWAAMAGELQRGLLPALVGTVSLIADLATTMNALREIGIPKWLINILTVTNPGFALSRAQFEASQNRGRAVAASASPRVPLTPQEAFAAESTRIQTARGREALQRDIQQGELDLLRRKADIETSIADQRRAESDYEKEIADFRWNLEQRIFQLRSNAIRAEAEVANTMSQLRSAQIGLDFDERLLNAAPGAETEFLEASKNLLQTQEQTENRIAQNKISTELRIEDLKRQQVDRERQLEREKESLERRKEQLLRGRAQIERGIADYQIGAANYMRETAERVLDAWRQMNAEMQASAAVSGGGGATEIASRDLNANAKAWLKVIRYAEGTAGPRGYNTMFTGKQFNNFADHPRQLQSGGGYTSDAAGAYQFLSTTWDRTKRALGLPNFAPASQDKGAAYLAAMRGVDITSAPFTPQNVARLAPEWASLPTLQGRSYYGQPVKRFGDLQNVYRAGLVSASVGGSGGRGGFNGTMQTPPDGMMPLAQAALSPAKIPAPTRPTWQALPGAPNTAPMERGMQQAAERELAAVQNLLELQNSLAETEEKSAFNAMRRVALGQNRLQESEDQLRLQRHLANAVGATTEREQEKLDLIAGQRAEYEKLLMDTDLQRREVERLRRVFAETEGKSGLSPERAQEINRLLDLRIQRQEESNRLDQQSLDLQQKRTALLERDSTLRAAAATGAGLRAGLIGAQAEALERGLIRGDSAEELRKNVEAAKALEDQQLIWDNLEKNIVDVSNAISGGLTNGLLDVISGARKIEDVGREVLDGIARTFADAAQQQLSTLMQRKLASMLGGPEGPLTKMLGGASAAAGPQALGAASLAASNSVMAFGVALQTVTAQMGVSSALSGLGSAALSGAGSAFSAAVPNILGSFFPGASPLPSFPFGGFLANGGTAVPGKGYIVGENEPEFFFPGVAGRVVPRSDMEKAAALQEGESSNEPIDIRYTVTEQRGERYVTEEQFRKGMASTSKRTQAMTYAGMRNNKQIREYTGI